MESICWTDLAFSCILIATGIATIFQIRSKICNSVDGDRVLPREQRAVASRAYGSVGTWMLWFLSSFELFHYFQDREWIPYFGLLCAVSLSLYRAVFARTLQVIGLVSDSKTIRTHAVVFFAFVVGKVFIYDIWLELRDFVCKTYAPGIFPFYHSKKIIFYV